MSPKTPITVAHGDGIGPEIMAATLQILEAAGADRITKPKPKIKKRGFSDASDAPDASRWAR